MANLSEIIQYDAGVYQIETTDPVLGGPSGTTNVPLKNLANRTAYLKKHVDDLESGATIPPGVATQTYVQAELNKRDRKASVRAATTANISLSGTQTIDGVALVAPDRVLVKNQTDGAQNGIYVVSATAWARATDADENVEVTAGMEVFVSEGTLQADTIWKLTTNDPITVGTTLLTFADITSGYAPLASPNFSGNPTAPTPAQFDSDTSLATTEFVQRALGSLAGQINVTTNSTLTAADVGKRVNLNGSGIQVYLPPLAQVPVGAVYMMRASQPATVFRQGGDVLQVGDSQIASIAMTTGEVAVFVAGQSAWNIEGGDSWLKYSPKFGATIATNGYHKLPSGLLIQWGSSTTSASADVTVTFPVAFTQRFSLSGSLRETSTTAYMLKIGAAAIPGAATTNFTANAVDTSGARTVCGFEWVAIGI